MPTEAGTSGTAPKLPTSDGVSASQPSPGFISSVAGSTMSQDMDDSRHSRARPGRGSAVPETGMTATSSINGCVYLISVGERDRQEALRGWLPLIAVLMAWRVALRRGGGEKEASETRTVSFIIS